MTIRFFALVSIAERDRKAGRNIMQASDVFHAGLQSTYGRAFARLFLAGSLALTVAGSALAEVSFESIALDNPTPQANAEFGFAVAGVGDVNGDGVPDVLVGAPRQNVGPGNYWQGRAFVFSGADGSPLHTLNNPGAPSRAEFGYAVAGAGDVNGDGVPDLLVGAPGQNVGVIIEQGQAFVFSGADGSRLHTLNDPTPQRMARFGSDVAGVGDVNGDGVPDLLVGAPRQDVGVIIEQGQAFVFSGADGSLLHTLNDPNPQAAGEFFEGPEFGKAVAGVGDVNGDGVPDLLVGAPGQHVGGNSVQGQAFVFSGADGSLLHTLDDPTPQALARFGSDVAGVGDVNGDGVPDLLVGAVLKDVAGVIQGQPLVFTNQGQAFVFSGADGSLLHTLDDPTPQALARFGSDVAGVGDVNGDGVPDLLVGAVLKDVAGVIQGQPLVFTNQGQAFVFSGADGSLLHTLDDPTQQEADVSSGGFTMGAQFGKDVAGVGDVNGDGVPDLLVGAVWQKVEGNALQGRAFVFSGADGSLLHTLDTPNPEVWAFFGYGAAGVGDVNGDGVPDLLVSARALDVGGNANQGRAFLFVSTSISSPRQVCRIGPWLCKDVAIIERGAVVLNCPVRGCLIFDPVPKNCLLKFKCPGCPPGGMCPSWYNLFLDGLKDVWDVGLYDPQGNPVLHKKFKQPSGVVLSFRPSKEHYIEGQIGDYFLVFKMGMKGKPGVDYRIPMRVERSDRLFDPKGRKGRK